MINGKWISESGEKKYERGEKIKKLATQKRLMTYEEDEENRNRRSGNSRQN